MEIGDAGSDVLVLFGCVYYHERMATQPSTLTDQELYGARLEIDDPMAMPNLCMERPPADLPPEIVGEYHLPPGTDFIWCCHCQGHHHRNGFVITNLTQKHYLLGSECGPKHYDLSFKLAAREHKAKVKRKGVLERMKAIWANGPVVRATIHDVLRSEGLRLIDFKRDELRRASGSAFSALATSVRSGMPLYETISVRDVAAEQRRDEKLRGSETGPRIYSQERMSLGQVAGAAIFRESGDCRDHLLLLRAKIEAVEAFSREVTDAYSIPALTKAVRAAEEAWQAAQDAIVDAEFADAFFLEGNLNRLERWSAANRYFRLVADGDRLLISGEGSRQTTILPLPSIKLPRLPRLKAD